MKMRLHFVAFSLLLVLPLVVSVPHDEPKKVDVVGNINAQDPTSQFFLRAVDVSGEQQQEVQTFAEHSTKIEGSPVNKLTEDGPRKPLEFSNLPQNRGKPAGFSQLPINEKPQGFLELPHDEGKLSEFPALLQNTGKPTGLPVLPHDAREPTRLSKLPKYNQDQPSIFSATSRGVNVDAPSTKHPLVEKLFKIISGTAAHSANNVNNDIDSGNAFLDSSKNVPKLDEESKDYGKLKRPSARPSGKTGAAGDSEGGAKKFQEQNYVEPSSEGIIPPTTSSVRFSSRGSYKVRRRKRRSTEDNDNNNDAVYASRFRLINITRKDDCANSLSKAVLVFLASAGWFAALAAVLPCCLSRFRICRRMFPDPVAEENESQSNILIEDAEMGNVTKTDNDDKEMTICEKHNNRPAGYCNIETINEESSTTEIPTANCDVETFKEEDITTSTLSQFPVESSMVDRCASTGYCTVETLNEEGSTANLPPIAPPLPKVVGVETNDKEVSKNEKTMKKVTLQSDMDCKTQRRASERVKVIRRLSSSIRRPSLLDEILVAREVIMDENLKNAKVFERRKVIKEATAHERKGSLLEEICFAKSVISPSEEDRERSENSYHRRHLIKERSSSRRLSLADNITMAKDVLLGTIETVV